MTTAFTLVGVSKHYENFALKDISLSMPEGQVMGLVGINGAGKTTLLRILSGLALPDSGSVEVLGHAMPEQQVAAKKELGFATEDMRLYKTQTLRWHMDFIRAIYPGWDGLAEGRERVIDQVLVPHAQGQIGLWQRYDWELGEYAETEAVDPSLALIVEGSGLLTPVSARLGDVRVWLESPAPVRKHRALTRDGDTYRPHWDRWAAQEDAHIAEHAPARCADMALRIP